MIHTMIEGTTEPQDFQLLNEGAPLNGTGFTVGIQFRETGISGVTAAWLDQATGTVRVSGAGALAKKTYHVRFTLTDGSAKVGFVPNADDPFDWVVQRF